MNLKRYVGLISSSSGSLTVGVFYDVYGKRWRSKLDMARDDWGFEKIEHGSRMRVSYFTPLARKVTSPT
jgi:hypothetical protein